MQPVKTIVALIITLFFSLTLSSSAEAKIVSEENAVVEQSEVIHEDLFVSGERVVILGTINGDVYAAGGTVTVRGDVNGDINAVGGEVRISGRTRGDVQALAGQVQLANAVVEGNVRVVTGSLITDNESTVAGSVVMGTGTARISSPVGKGLGGVAGELVVNNKIGGVMEVGVGRLEFGPQARIIKDVRYSSEEDAFIDPEASIAGQVRRVVPQRKDFRQTTRRVDAFADTGMSLWSYASSLLIGLLMLRSMKKPVVRVSGYIRKSFFKTLGWGFIGLFLTVPALLFIALTLIGIPLAFILLGLFIVELYIAKIFVAVYLGEQLAKTFPSWSSNEYVRFALGLGLYYILTWLPIIRFPATLIFLLLGLGAILQAKRTYLFGTTK